jgi:hypothetical protein
MSHYTANLRDIEFCLFDLLKRDEILGKSIFKEIDRDTSMGMLEEIKRLAENDLADSFVESDRLGVQFDKATGDIKLPESFKKSYRTFMDNEWWRIDAPVEIGLHMLHTFLEMISRKKWHSIWSIKTGVPQCNLRNQMREVMLVLEELRPCNKPMALGTSQEQKDISLLEIQI